MIEVSERTKARDFAPFREVLTEDSAKRLLEVAVFNKFGKDGFWSMTIADFFAIAGGDIACLVSDNGESLFDECRIKAFATFVDDFTTMLKSLELPSSEEDERNARGCLGMTLEEGIYIFCRQYFGLHSFADVDSLTLADVVLAKKDTYNKAVIDRNVINSIKQQSRRNNR